MDRPAIEAAATGAAVVLGALAAALMIPASRRLVVDLVEDRLRDFDVSEAGRMVRESGRRTYQHAFSETRREASDLFRHLGEMLGASTRKHGRAPREMPGY